MLFGKSLTSQLQDVIKEAQKAKANPQNIFFDLSKAAKQFFKNRYNVSYKFTFEDLKQNLKQRNIENFIQVEQILNRLGEFEFNKDKINNQDIIAISKDLLDLMEGNIPSEQASINEEMFAPPQFHTAQLNDLPMFNVDLNNEVNSLIDELMKNKDQLQTEMDMINKEKELLEKEKALPTFNEIKQANVEMEALDKRKEELSRKEAEIEDKIIELKRMETEINEQSAKLKNYDQTLKSKEDFVISKEKIIEEIRKDFKEKYEQTLEEIESVKEELKEKEQNFLEIQKFYQKREDKLSIEEGNLLEEKRRYGHVVKRLIDNHLDIAKDDLARVERELQMAKEKERKITQAMNEYVKKLKRLIAEKDLVKKGIEGKKKYFSDLEKEFSGKDEEFKKLEDELEKRQEKVLKLEIKLQDFSASIEFSEEETRKKIHELELKELDLKAVEKQIRTLTYEMKNHQLRLDTREKYLQKRIEGFEELRREIKSQIAKEKRAVSRIEENLHAKGRYVARKLGEVEHLESDYDSVAKEQLMPSRLGSRDLSEELIEYDVPHQVINEIKITHLPDTRLGNPNVLDILRLINIGRDLLENNMIDKSRDSYLEIQKLFESLREDEKDELYGMITDVFKTKGEYSEQIKQKIESLLGQFRSAVSRGDMVSSGHIYSMLQQKYIALPKEEKQRYYNLIMELYGQATSTAVQTY